MNDLLPQELPEAFSMTLMPVKENEADMSNGHPEGEGTEETMRSNDRSLVIIMRKWSYIVLLVDILEKSITSTQANLKWII